MSASGQTDLLKLTREQLKRLCKEHGHTGYSKCTKPQLVALLGSDTPSKSNSSTSSVALLPILDASSSSSTSKKRPKSGSGTGGPVSKKQKRPNLIPPSSPPLVSSVPSKTGRNPSVPRDLFVSPVPTAPVFVSLAIQQRPVLPMLSLPPSITDYSLGLPQPPSQSHPASNLQAYTHEAEEQERKITFPVIDNSHWLYSGDARTQPKKFLDPRISMKDGHLAPCGPQDTLRPTILPPSPSVSMEQLPIPYLDFPMLPVPAFDLIGMPPSIQDRKKVCSWSIILSGIADADRRACVLVSRMFRHAVYLSASVILFSKFPGRRLDDVARKYSPSTFNFWPYLRARETELAKRRAQYLRSFLHRFYGTSEPIGRDLWSSPDNQKQYAVAVGFVMTMTWFAVSNCPDLFDTTPWLHSAVVGAREVVPDEVWEVTTTTIAQGSIAEKKETFYILEPTYEVIGRPPRSTLLLKVAPNAHDDLPIRVDWSEYVSDRIISRAEAPGKRLLDRVQWAHYEEYQNGISRHWLTRAHGEGEIGKLKKQVAEKYVLASVVENSVSGPWRSVQEMANESFAPAEPSRVNKRLNMKMKMFLSAHHHVESVHFQTPGKKPFHPAVASVQTPAREYFILKDNGMLIGTEEDGIKPLWQTLLGCDEKGLAIA